MKQSKDLIKLDLERVAAKLERGFSRREYGRLGHFSYRQVEVAFGSWSAALEAAGIGRPAERAAVKEVDDAWKKRKEQLKAQAEQRHVSTIRQQQLKMDLLKGMLEESLAQVEAPVVEVLPLKIMKRVSGPREHVTLWFDFSDLQLGTLMTAEQMGGLNKHDWSTWVVKLAIWTQGVIDTIARYAMDYEIDKVIIACLGDMVEGQDIFKGQVWQVDRHVVDQAIQGAADTAPAFLRIFLSFPGLEFHVLEVFGNHGRTGRKGEAPYACSMDKIYQRLLEAYLEKTSELKNVTYHRNEAWFHLVQIYGWNHLMLHGDQGMSSLWSNRPTVNGLEKGITRYNQMLQQQIHFLHCGHFHNEWALSFNMSYMLINGSFIGTSNFSASQMVAAAPPMQTVHVFKQRVGLAVTERIHLTAGDVRRPIEPNMLERKPA